MEEEAKFTTYAEVAAVIRRAIEGTGWYFKFYSEDDAAASWIFEASSPAGEDLPIEGDCGAPGGALEEIAEEVRSAAECYDVDEHVGLWAEGRGTHGIPSGYRELVEDAEAIGRMYDELAEAVDSAL